MSSKAVKRISQEAKELQKNQDSNLMAAPLEDNCFEWHFSVIGPIQTDFEGGVYHGRMILPANYPFAPPEIYLLTPSGRFETNKKICLSISSFHPESWQPSWGIRTALIALTAFFESESKGAVGSLDAAPEDRRRLAKLSKDYKCSTCGFDSHSPFIAPATVATEEPSIEDTESPVANVTREEPSPPATTIFPSSRGGMPSPAAIGMPAVGAEMNGGARAGEMENPIAHRPIENPIAPIMGGIAAGNVVNGAGTGGGSPLVVDRLIMVVLMMILALIAQRLS